MTSFLKFYFQNKCKFNKNLIYKLKKIHPVKMLRSIFLNYIGMLLMSSTGTDYEEDFSGLSERGEDTFLLFGKNFEPITNISEFPLVIKNIFKQNTGPIIDNNSQSSSILKVRFLIYSNNGNSRNVKNLKSVLAIVDSSDLEKGIEDFSNESENRGVVKMVFETTIDIAKAGDSVTFNVVFPKNKNLFDLNATIKSREEGNPDLLLVFSKGPYSDEEFLKTFKTDTSLYGMLFIAREESIQGEERTGMLFPTYLILLDTVANKDKLIKEVWELLSFFKEDLTFSRNQTEKLKQGTLWDKHFLLENIKKRDICSLKKSYETILYRIQRIRNIIEKTHGFNNDKELSDIQEQFEEVKNLIHSLNIIVSKEEKLLVCQNNSKIDNLLKIINEQFEKFNEQCKTLEESLNYNNPKESVLITNFYLLVQTLSDMRSNMAEITNTSSMVKDDKLIAEISKCKETMEKRAETLKKLESKYEEKKKEMASIKNDILSYSTAIKNEIKTFRSSKSEVYEFLNDDESALKNIEKFLDKLESNERAIEDMKSIRESQMKKEYYDQYPTNLEDEYNTAIKEYKELHSKIISSSLLNPATLQSFMSKKIEDLTSRIISGNLNEKLTQLLPN